MSAWLVAWLQAGPQGVISHDSVLALYGPSDLLPHRIHMTVPRTASRRRPEPQLHTKRLEQDDVAQYEGLSMTTVLRTLVDVTAAGLADEQVRHANHEALRRGLVARESLLRLTASRGGRIKRLVDELLREETQKRPMIREPTARPGIWVAARLCEQVLASLRQVDP